MASGDSKEAEEGVAGNGASRLQNLTVLQVAFLSAYVRTVNITKAAEIVGATRQSHYEWLSKPAYREAFGLAEEQAAVAMEEEADRRGILGVERLKFTGKGEVIIDPRTGEPYIEHAYSDRLLELRLKALRPNKYREHQEVVHAGEIEISHRVTELRAAIAALREDDELARMERKRAVSNGAKSGPHGRNGKSRPMEHGPAPRTD